jgi:hypothetical protein
MKLGGRHAEPRAITDDTEDLDLSVDPFDDDLGDQLAATAPRRIATRTTAVLAGAVLVIGGFIGGAQVQKHYGTPATSQSGAPAAAAGNFAGGQRRAGQSPGAGQNSTTGDNTAASGTITGTVKLIDGTTIYVETPDGRVVTVRTTDTTTVQIARSGSLKDLTAGATVTIEAPNSGSDTVNATKVTKAQ